MSGRLVALPLLVFALAAAPNGRAVEPQTVNIEGAVASHELVDRPPRDAAVAAGLVAALIEVARDLLPPESFAAEEARLREVLKARTGDFVLTYRTTAALVRRKSRLDPVIEEWAIGLAVAIDVEELRSFLAKQGFLPTRSARPSLALRGHAVGALADGDRGGAQARLERSLRRALEKKGFVVVEPALRPEGGVVTQSALELARSLGADVGVELSLDWREQASGATAGGVLVVEARALRGSDGSEVGVTRIEGVGWHPERDAALARAVEAVEAQLGENLSVQLERSWSALAPTPAFVELELIQVGSLAQVTAVQKALAGPLRARAVELRALSGRTAALWVTSELSAAALEERLSATLFEGFGLVPVESGAGRARMRIERANHAPDGLVPGPAQIDTKDPN